MPRSAKVLVETTVLDMLWPPNVLSGRQHPRLNNMPTAKVCALWRGHKRCEQALVDISSTHLLDMPCTLSHRNKTAHTYHDTSTTPLNQKIAMFRPNLPKQFASCHRFTRQPLVKQYFTNTVHGWSNPMLHQAL